LIIVYGIKLISPTKRGIKLVKSAKRAVKPRKYLVKPAKLAKTIGCIRRK